MRLLGYADRMSVAPGSPIEFKVSCARSWFVPHVVRLGRGGSPRHEVDLVEHLVPADLPARLPGRTQTTRSGSYLEARLPSGAAPRALTLAVWLKPTLLTDRWQAVLSLWSGPETATAAEISLAVSRCGVALLVDDTEAVAMTVAPVRGQWAFLVARVDTSGGAGLTLYRPGDHQPVRAGGVATVPDGDGGLIRVGALARPSGPAALFNGKLARPVVATRAWSDAAIDRLAEGADPVGLARGLELPHGEFVNGVGPASGGQLCALDLAADPAVAPWWTGAG